MKHFSVENQTLQSTDCQMFQIVGCQIKQILLVFFCVSVYKIFVQFHESP
jgi:hypothetical protein